MARSRQLLQVGAMELGNLINSYLKENFGGEKPIFYLCALSPPELMEDGRPYLTWMTNCSPDGLEVLSQSIIDWLKELKIHQQMSPQPGEKGN